MKRKTVAKILFKIVDFEHSLYCITGCRISLPLHKLYYKCRKRAYDQYIDTVAKQRYGW